MDMYTLVAQLIGLVAMAFNTLSYQLKDRKRIIAFQMVGTFLFSINFMMLGAVMGCILNLVAAFRAVVFLNKEKLRADSLPWFIGFLCVYALSYILTFTAFGKDPTIGNLILEFLPVVGMVAITVSFRLNDAAAIRKYGFVSSACWLVYNFASFSIGAIVCEVISMGSILIGMFRLDRKKP